MTTPVRHRPTRARIGFAVVALMLVGTILAVNQAAEAALADGRSIDLRLLHLLLVYNPGAAFSLGAGLPAWVVLGVTGAITAAVAFYGWRTSPTAPVTRRIGLAAILAGALANLLDRASDGVVTDYLHTGWFPTFNLADTLITLGAGLLILSTLRHPKPSGPQDTTTAARPTD
ncbi:MAG: signal peptidase II [Actinomycetota bacterium]|nr:signal peptidase II [Actinomycetota bacterium]